MVDCRTMLSALVAAYDQHRRWMMAEKFAALQRAVDHARDVLAQPEPAPAADGEVAELPPRPPLMEPPAHLALERYGVTWDGSPDKPLLTRMADGYWTPWHVAADLLERQAASLPVARLPEDAQVIEPVNRTILAPIPTPIPVSERLPEKAEMTDDDEVWVEYPGGEYPLGDTGDYDWEPHKWILSPIAKFTIRENRRWLPAHALPLPEVE